MSEPPGTNLRRAAGDRHDLRGGFEFGCALSAMILYSQPSPNQAHLSRSSGAICRRDDGAVTFVAAFRGRRNTKVREKLDIESDTIISKQRSTAHAVNPRKSPSQARAIGVATSKYQVETGEDASVSKTVSPCFACLVELLTVSGTSALTATEASVRQDVWFAEGSQYRVSRLVSDHSSSITVHANCFKRIRRRPWPQRYMT